MTEVFYYRIMSPYHKGNHIISSTDRRAMDEYVRKNYVHHTLTMLRGIDNRVKNRATKIIEVSWFANGIVDKVIKDCYPIS